MSRTAEGRIKKRREQILQLLMTEIQSGKTVDEIAKSIGYSSSTTRQDLGEMRAAGIVELDDSRKPHKWRKT